jgi:hypothetical protein
LDRSRLAGSCEQANDGRRGLGAALDVGRIQPERHSAVAFPKSSLYVWRESIGNDKCDQLILSCLETLMRRLVLVAVAWCGLLAGCDRGGSLDSGIQEQERPNAEARSGSPGPWPPWSVPVETAHLKPAQPTEGMPIPPRSFVEWEFGKHSEPVRYAMGAMKVVVKGVPSDVLEDDFMLRVTVEAPGRAIGTFEDFNVNLRFPVQLGYGSLDRDGTPFLLVKSYSGGPHCCTNLAAAVVRPSQVQIVKMESWDGQPLETFPSDHDGDGSTDFILSDGAFLYAFDAYSNSWPPPKIMNIDGEKFADVSTRPGFRDLFIKHMREARERCLDRTERHPDGFCAGYVASALRARRFEAAWAEVTRHRGPASDWKLNPDCEKSRTRLGCPLAYQGGASDYLTALRSHLRRFGYIS